MKIIIGLGNPGLEYRNTRHNIGFIVVKELAKEYKIKLKDKAHFSILGKGRIEGEDVVLALPQTYMNLSGRAVSELFAGFAKDIQDLIVICDDINIELGRIRIKKQGSAGGHRGLESIIQTIGRDDFARMRIGIATEVHKGDITGYVLSPFKRKEMRNVAHVTALAVEAVGCMVKKGMDEAMTRFNKRKIGTS